MTSTIWHINALSEHARHIRQDKLFTNMYNLDSQVGNIRVEYNARTRMHNILYIGLYKEPVDIT